jgi:hypothetical protein
VELGVRLSPTRTDAAALCPFPLSFSLSAASILNSLGSVTQYNTYRYFQYGD